MDDFNVNCLYECRNELGARLLNTLNPCIVDGFKSILEESVNVCKENKEMNKYLITFQNLIGRVPKWNKHIIEEERKRIIAKTGIDYLETLVNGVHVCVVKILTAVRSSQKQKKIDIDIPVIDDFIHKVYVISARKIYKNVYLFEKDIPPLQIQKHNRELEIIINECILNALRESISTETLLKVYMDDEDVVERGDEDENGDDRNGFLEPLKVNRDIADFNPVERMFAWLPSSNREQVSLQSA
jgi:hypothetical protein